MKEVEIFYEGKLAIKMSSSKKSFKFTKGPSFDNWTKNGFRGEKGSVEFMFDEIDSWLMEWTS